MEYRVSYTYQNPGRGGPFRGTDVLAYKPEKGDQIRACFGLAIVQTVSTVKRYVCGDGKKFSTFELATEHANKVFQETGNVIAVERRN